MRRHKAWWLAPLVALALLAGPGRAFGQDTADDLARRHFESGVAYLQESDYDNALKAFEKAYELSKRPEILINIATVHERRNELDQAVASLEKYLEVAPEGDQREMVGLRIQNLKKRIADQAAGKEADAGAAANEDGGASLPPPGPSATGTTGPEQPPPVESKSNVPAYVLLGIGGVTAAGAIITGVLAKGEYDSKKDSCSPHCSSDDVSSGKTLALTSTVLTGVAVVSASIGAVLLFTNSSSQEKAAKKPPARWAVGFSPTRGGAAASAAFTF
jgi:Tetratricopeptide repeat